MHLPLLRVFLVALAIAVLAAAGIAANLVLLGYADWRNDPVGKLTPRVDITQPDSPAPPQTNENENRERDVEEPDD